MNGFHSHGVACYFWTFIFQSIISKGQSLSID